MGKLSVLALAAGAAAVMTLPAAQAADMPPVMHKPVPVVEDFAGGWYLRGDIGMSNQRVGKLHNVLFDAPGVAVTQHSNEFSSAPFFGLGVGYQWNSWLRFDLTGEYRGKSTFRGMDTYTPEPGSPTGIGVNDYHAKKSEWVVMANAYFDLGTWGGLTPFVGGGIGAAYNMISGFRDVNVPTGGVAYAGSAGTWNFAWAIHAGIGYQVSPNFTVELAYRYLNLGDARTGDIIAYDGTNNVYNPMYFRNIDSHDVKLGVRWMLNAPAPVYAPPLMTKG